MKIGIYAGTFDPVHNGHLMFAQTAINEAGLEKVVLVAEKEPYRKKPHVSWDHRQAMLERATENIDQIDHNYQFAAELSHQHTMQNMLEVAKKYYGENNDFWFLVGSDLFEHMHRWEDTLEHHQYGGFVVALRDEHTTTWLSEQTKRLHTKFPKLTVILVENTKPHISSSQIRAIVASNQQTTDVPSSVIEYIKKHRLYASDSVSADVSRA